MSIQFIPDGYCGLYCAACPDYQAAKKSDLQASVVKDDVCYGCKSEHVKPGWCEICTMKKCAQEKGIEFCYECTEYPCEQLEDFKTEKQCPYHNEIYDYLDTIKTKGRETWLEEMEKRWSCPQCATTLIWWDTVCPECGAGVNGYEKPGK